MTQAADAKFSGIVKQVGRLIGPSEISNGASFVREDGRLMSVGIGNSLLEIPVRIISFPGKICA